MQYIIAAWKYLDGHKRSIGVVAGIVLSWAWKYEVAPEKYLDLANMVLSTWGVVAIGDAVRKSAKAQ